MNAAAYCLAAITAHRARRAGVTCPEELRDLAVDAVIDSEIIPVDESFDFDGAEATDAMESVFKALEDLGILVPA